MTSSKKKYHTPQQTSKSLERHTTATGWTSAQSKTSKKLASWPKRDVRGTSHWGRASSHH
jgi:hypothetical protein